MWLLIVVCLVLAFFALVSLRLIPPPNASTLARIIDGQLEVTRGSWRPYTKQDVAEILRDSSVLRGFIAVTPDKRVTFSRSIPGAIHQRLRNVIMNEKR